MNHKENSAWPKIKTTPPVPEKTGEWTTTADPEPKPFVFFNNGPDTDNHIIGSDKSLWLVVFC